MTANERIAEIKAELVEIYDTWGLGDEILLGSQSEIAGLSDTAGTLIAALETVLGLHSRVFDMNNTPACRECADDYPCPTVEAITEALGVDQ